MGKGKKGWINKKSSVTFQLVQGGENTELLPLTANPNRLLEADPDEWEEGEEGNYEYDDEYEEDEDAWGENRGADAGFDYMKLTRPIGRAGGVFVSRDGTVLPSDRAPDMDDSERQQQFRSETDMLNQRQREIAQEEGEIDPEILAALDQFDEGEYEEFDESFITELQQGGEDDQDYSSEEDLPPFDPTAAANTRGRRLDDLDYDSLDEELGGSYDPSDDELEYAGMEKRYAYEPESRESSQPAVRRVGATAEQQMTESMFDVAMQRFELDELDDPEEPVVMRGSMPAATFNHIFDEFLHDQSVSMAGYTEVREILRPVASNADTKPPATETPKESTENDQDEAPANLPIVYNFPESESDEDTDSEAEDPTAEYEYISVKAPPQWDAESIISTYSNLDNHPTVIGTPQSQMKIRINQRGLARLTDSTENQSKRKRTGKTNEKQTITRPKNETPEEKRNRKATFKLQKQQRRVEKKALKQEFRTEMTKQQRASAAAPLANRTILKY